MTQLIIGSVLICIAVIGLILDKRLENLFNQHPATALLLELAVFCTLLAGIMNLAGGAATL